MKLYVSTDTREAKELVESLQPRQKSWRYIYDDLPAEEAAYIETCIGFNPMSFIQPIKETSQLEVNETIDKLRSCGLRVAIQQDDQTIEILSAPSDLPDRDTLLREALRMNATKSVDDPSHLLLCFSNGTRNDVIRIAERTQEWRKRNDSAFV